jgi:arylformamidase
MTNVIDISLPITNDMPIYPGTKPTVITTVKSKSGSSILSEICMTSHAGTHIDAPSHVLENAASIDELPLDTFYGRCRVLDMVACEVAITVDDLKVHKIRAGERLLFKTSNSMRGFQRFYDDYVYLDSDAAEYLAYCDVLLVGIDALSIKKRGLDDNTAHKALLKESIPILEGLNLRDIKGGEYTLCAFPLAFMHLDGAPTRALLLTSS